MPPSFADYPLGQTPRRIAPSHPRRPRADRCFRMPEKRKAPPEGRGGAFGPTAEAVDRRRRSQGGGAAAISWTPYGAQGAIGTNAKSETEPCARRSPQAGPHGYWRKKRGSIRRWSLKIGPKPNQSGGEWTREEDTPFAGWASVEGGGYDVSPGVAELNLGRRKRSRPHRQVCICLQPVRPAMRLKV